MSDQGSTGEAGAESDDGEAVDAALDAVEPERLLGGEREDTPYLDDAEHWVRVYAELLDFKRALLALAHERVESMHDTAASEVEETDLKILRAEAERFARRLDFWGDRVRVLTPRPGNA